MQQQQKTIYKNQQVFKQNSKEFLNNLIAMQI